MNLRVIGAILAKDFTSFLRDRFYVMVSVLGLVVYVLVFWLLPGDVDETISIGVHGAGLTALPGLEPPGQGGLDVTAFSSTASLVSALGDAGLVAGLDFPDDFVAALGAGERRTVTLYVVADIPDEYRTALNGLVREIGYAVAGSDSPVVQPPLQEVVLGPDRAGDQISLRERMRPLIAYFVLLVETFALASLVATEVQARTVTAVLVTPARTTDFLVAKGVIGTTLAFSQAALAMAAIGSFGRNPLPLVVVLALGAVLVTGLGLVAGSLGRDFIGVIFWTVLFVIPLAVPAFAALFPGSAAGWVKAIPSYGLVQSIVGLTAYREGWSSVAPQLAGLAVWGVVVFAVGTLVLKRKVETL